MEFRLLGPVEVVRGGQVLSVRSRRQRNMLALLLLRANQVVAADEIVEQVWAETPPANGRATVYTQVMRLRRLLAGDHGEGPLATQPSGYQLTVAPGELDLNRFDELVVQADRAGKTGNVSTEAGLLSSALTLWRGEPLANVDAPYLQREAVPLLAERRLRVLERRIDADLRMGGHRELIAELQSLTGKHPLRERFWVQLMLSYYRSGRQAEALDTYRSVRRLLVESLGLEPGAELRELHRKILTNDPELLPDASFVDPPAPALELDAAPYAPPVTPAQLPTDIVAFTGRTAELRWLDAALPDQRSEPPPAAVISAIIGAPGVGKTALAVHWAHRNASRFPDGQLYVNLRGFDPSGSAMCPAEAVRGLLEAFGVPEERVPASVQARVGLYRSLLAGRRVLVVLDNARDAEQVRPLLPGGPGCFALVTSRNQLSGLVTAEAARPITLDLLSDGDVRAMLVRRIGGQRAAAEPDAVDAIVARCTGLPLAVAIAAARAVTRPGFPLVAIADQMRVTTGGLDGFTSPDATTDLRSVLSWSYGALAADAARMFRLLGLPPGPDVTVPVAASLAGVTPGRAQELLSDLNRAHLLTEHLPGRYVLHDLLRAYAKELSRNSDSETDRQTALRRLFDHHLHSAYSAALVLHPRRGAIPLPTATPGVSPEQFDDVERAMAWLSAEKTAMLAVIRQAAETGFHRHAWQSAWTIGDFLDRQGHWHDWATSQLTALSAARRSGDRLGLAHSHRLFAISRAKLGDHDDAEVHLRNAMALFRDLNDHAGEATAHTDLDWLLGESSQRQRLPSAIPSLSSCGK